MLKEKWREVVDNIKANFDVIEHDTDELEDSPGIVEFIVFEHPQGVMKLERTEQPKMLDKKTSYSTRIGADVKVDYQYSDDEVVDFLKTFLWNEEDEEWKELKINMFE